MTSPDPQSPAPGTQHPGIDAALAKLADLDRSPLADHHARLTAAHDALHAALDEADRPDEADQPHGNDQPDGADPTGR